MSFISIQFLIFFALTYLIFRLVHGQKYKTIVLLIASYIFYAYWDWRFLFLLLFQTMVCYLSSFAIMRVRNKNSENLKLPKIYMGIGCALLLVVLALFKYFNFFVDSFCSLFQISFNSIVQLLLPVGISFYTFQALSYVVDVYRKEVTEKYSVAEVALYVGFFPQVISGPIVFSSKFLPQTRKEYHFNKEETWSAIWIFINGVVKKFVIADRLGVCVDAVFSAPGAYDSLSLTLAVFTYSLQLYCDFAGYSDMAIGIAKMFGFDLGKNFNMPYLTKNPTVFWKHWHISLSSWLQKYLYISLGGNRKGKLKTYLNLFITMLLGGLWHGANWTFIVWGALHGIALIVHKLFMQFCKGHPNLSPKSTIAKNAITVLCIVLNFIFVSFCWIFFRADSISQAFMIIGRIFSFVSGVRYIYIYSIIFGVVVLGVSLFAYFKNSGNGFYVLLNMEKLSSKIIFCLAIFLIALLMYESSNPFIYQNF